MSSLSSWNTRDMIALRDMNKTSNKLLLTLVGMSEEKLGNYNSEKSNGVKNLLFTKIVSKEQYNALADNNYSNDTIDKYFVKFESVWFCCIYYFDIDYDSLVIFAFCLSCICGHFCRSVIKPFTFCLFFWLV